MNINFNVQLFPQASFKIEKFKEDGTITYQGKEFHNEVLNSGLNLLENYSVDAITYYVNLGSSNTPVDITQTGLLDRKFSTSTLFNNGHWYGTSYEAITHGTYPNLYFYIGRTFQFNIGTCTGTFKEIGLSKDNNANYFNRQLIKDSNGNPIDLIVAADEGIRITCEVKVYFGNTFKSWSKLFKLNLKGATAGGIVLREGTRTVSFNWNTLNFTYNCTNGSRPSPLPYFSSMLSACNTAFGSTDAITMIIKDKDGNYLIACNTNLETDFNLTIDSHSLTGGSAPPELTVVEDFQCQVSTGTFDHTNETTLVVTPITYKVFPYVRRQGTYGDNHGVWGTQIGTRVGVISPYGNWWIGVAGSVTSGTIIENIWQDANTRKKTIRYYYAPGALSSNTMNISQVTIGTPGTKDYSDDGVLFKFILSPSITITNTEEFSIDYSIYWGRLS